MTILRNYLAFILPFCVLFLILFGALVTSHGAGLSVPDWPTTFNENMFTYPVHKWTGGIFWEHGHRLIASSIGFLTLVLTVLILITEERKWVKILSCVALVAVIIQGILGGLTVIYKLPLAVSSAHAVLAQSFFIITIILAFSYSKEHARREKDKNAILSKLFSYSLITSGIIYCQLIIGAVMRHSEAGLAIPDFPTMNHSFLPSLSSQTITELNQTLLSIGFAPVDSWQVLIHLMHRFGALAVIISTVFLLVFILKNTREIGKKYTRHGSWIGSMVIVQFALGAITVLSYKDPFITSAHVAFGAALLGLTTLLAIRTFHQR